MYRSVFAPWLLAGQVVIVTGGGSGFVRCNAQELVALGAHVVLVGRNADKLRAVQAEIEADGGGASHAVCDIRDEATVQRTVADVVARHGASTRWSTTRAASTSRPQKRSAPRAGRRWSTPI